MQALKMGAKRSKRRLNHVCGICCFKLKKVVERKKQAQGCPSTRYYESLQPGKMCWVSTWIMTKIILRRRSFVTFSWWSFMSFFWVGGDLKDFCGEWVDLSIQKRRKLENYSRFLQKNLHKFIFKAKFLFWKWTFTSVFLFISYHLESKNSLLLFS